MCGIAGLSAAPGFRRDRLEASLAAMLKALRHRGPDGRGSIVIPAAGQHGDVGLANTRLAILDLSPAGNQPMTDSATGNWIVLNGEIYNHLEVRRALGDQVPRWRSHSDTETILQAYAAWGAGCVHRLRGMFAFVIYDAAAHKLWCVRDRFGIKPFYWCRSEAGFVFASEVRALLSTGLIAPRCSAEGLATYVRFGSASEPNTLIDGIESMPAGSWMEVQDGGIVERHTYWDAETELHSEPCNGLPTRGIRHHLEQAVEEHLLSDVPVAVFLSGGIDSAVITALAAQKSNSTISAFTVGFPGTSLDETKFAATIANRYRLEHHQIWLRDEEVVAHVPQAVEALDLPSADAVNTYLVAGAVARAGIKVVLSGLGGDELFGGYRAFKLLPWAVRLAPLLGLAPNSMKRRFGGKRAQELLARKRSLRERYRTLRSYWSVDDLRDLGVPPAGHNGERSGLDRLPLRSQISVFEMTEYMRNVLLRDSDAMSMAHSVELRVPFLNYALAQYCVRVGAATHGHKWMLLEATRDLLPAATRRRRKHGFVLPMDSWMRGSLQSYVRDGLEKIADSRLLPCVDFNRMLEAYTARQLPWSRLWQMVALGHWVGTHKVSANSSDHAAALADAVESASTD